jgi:integrase
VLFLHFEWKNGDVVALRVMKPIVGLCADRIDSAVARLLTAQRGGEVARMRWVDVDLDSGWWTIPAEHTKNGQPHRVPLTDDVVELIQALTTESADDRPEHVFVRSGGATDLHRAKKAPSAIARVLNIDFAATTCVGLLRRSWLPREFLACTSATC